MAHVGEEGTLYSLKLGQHRPSQRLPGNSTKRREGESAEGGRLG